MTTLDEFFRVGETVTLGSHTFGAEEIKAFARKFDPQRFHVDEKEAEGSLFGRLCASGWHTASTWMKYNLRHAGAAGEEPWDGPGPRPMFGPSPGFENLKWMKPVYAGDTIRYASEVTGKIETTGRPDWGVILGVNEGINQHGAVVFRFDSKVYIPKRGVAG